MNPKRTFQVAIIGLISILIFSNAWASSGERTFILESIGDQNAGGTAIIDDNHLSVQASGLKPDAVYTVWFVNTKPKKHEAGAGQEPYLFRTDNHGKGVYRSSLDESPFGKWAMIMIVLHPNGDPKDMKNMVGALKATL
jgi:hypothetical protein